MAFIDKANFRQQTIGTFQCICLGQTLQLHRANHDVLENSQMWEQIKLLEHHPHFLTDMVDVLFKRTALQRAINLMAIKPDFAAVGFFQHIDRTQKRAFA